MNTLLSRFTYTNYKGETEEREVQPLNLEFMPNPGFGYAPGFFLCALDPARGWAKRSFRLDERFVPLGEPDGEGTMIVAVCERGGMKSTSPLVATLAARLLAMDDDEMRKAAVISEAGNFYEARLDPQFCNNVRALAACALGQREPTDRLPSPGLNHVG